MNLRGFLKQTVEHRPKTGENDYSEPVHGAPRTIPARKEEKQKLVASAGGEQVLANTRVMLVDEAGLGDLVDGQAVVARESIVDVGGKLLGWTVYL